MDTVELEPDVQSTESHNTMVPTFCEVLNRQVNFDGMVTLTVDPPLSFRQYAFMPGQFNMLYAFGVGEAAISISGDPDDRSRLVHTIRDVGPVSHALSRIKVGESIGLRGPFGSSWPVESARGCDVIIVAGGLGLAPVRPAIHSIINRRNEYGRVALVYGAKNPGELIYGPELDSWKAQGVDIHIIVDHATPQWQGEIGLVTHLLAELDVNFKSSTSFVCGPEIMMRHTARELETLGAVADNIYLSMERNMKCALAWCGHCQFGTHFICKDGPIFNYTAMRDLLGIREL